MRIPSRSACAFRALALLLALAVGLSSTACITTMTGVAPATTPITADDTYTELGSTYGTAYGVQLLLIPIFPESLSKKSKERAVQRGGGNALTEVSQDYTLLFFYLINVYIAKTKGTAINLERGGRHS